MAEGDWRGEIFAVRCLHILKTTTPRKREETGHVAGRTEATPADEHGFLAANANRSRQYTQVHAYSTPLRA